MCGRYALIDGQKVFLTFEAFKALAKEKKALSSLPRYNAAPTQEMPVVAMRQGEITCQLMRWWLIPHWSKDGKVAFSTFNAKSETLAESRLFSPYFKGSRCLIPAEAFYEWKKTSVTGGQKGKKKEVGEKRPMCIRMKEGEPFMMAGLFSVWKDAKGEEHPTYTIITTEPNTLIEKIHNRMPVIMPEKHFSAWLDWEVKDVERLKKMLVPYPAASMEAYPVSTLVNSGRNDEPACLEPVEEK